MNIESLNKSERYENSENTHNGINAVNTFSFELELPNSSFAELLQENKEEKKDKNSEDILKQTDPANLADKKSKLAKNIQDMAIKDKIPVKLKDVENIKLLIYSHDMLKEKNKYKIDINSLNDNDIKFLKQFIENPGITLNSIDTRNLQAAFMVDGQGGQVSYKSFNISRGLADLIEYAYKSQKPVRLDFEGDSSVILRIDTEGKLAAEFLSSNKAMESILKNSIPHLRNKLDSEGIPYKEIVYKERDKKQNKEEQERN